MTSWRRRRDEQRAPARPQPFVLTRRDQQPPPGEAAGSAREALPGDLLAGRFAAEREALAFVAAVHDGSVAPRCLRSGPRPGQGRAAGAGSLWALREHAPSHYAELVWAAGGVPYAVVDGVLHGPGGHLVTAAELAAWPEVGWVELAAHAPLGAEGPAQREIVVVTTASIARWAMNRYHDAALEMRVSSARLAPALSPGPTRTAVLLRMKGTKGALPRAMLGALTRMPYTIVCRTGEPRLLVEHRARLPLSDSDLAGQVPGQESWIMGGPEHGVWRIAERSAELEPPLGVAPAVLPPARPAPERRPADLAITVRLVRSPGGHDVEDAKLLTDADLRVLRSYLSGDPAAERAFLILGDGHHLLAEPGGGAVALPFGLPLRAAGPAGLYIEAGHALRPSLPPAARARAFGLDGESVVIVCADRSHRLALRHAVPVWALWLADQPPVDPAPPSEAVRALLDRFDALEIPRPEPARDGRRGSPPAGPADAVAAVELRAEALVLEMKGRYAEAARRYREAGEPHLAGRMYELAAAQEGE
ncbi:hypothetical protein GCM10010404_30100 [Nonomuraea africana]|uniref:FtsH ternary system domain-containing protein n=1 Tax=Nonomuraea africana TaxID=46171 RepID=A0ABR9KFG2_9ACTN|nr:hypothetical protein [Nonomuraea africana]MBE1560729.1 hypothetical protein [Nonomuraea africana]